MGSRSRCFRGGKKVSPAIQYTFFREVANNFCLGTHYTTTNFRLEKVRKIATNFGLGTERGKSILGSKI